MTEPRPDAAERLLAGVGGGGHRPMGGGLSRHLDTHGPLPGPQRYHDRHWGDRLLMAIEEAGLTGRGGAGFPTARKLATVRSLRRRPVVVANVMEGEPASAKDRLLAMSAPHLVLDGAEAVAQALQATAVWVCVPQGHEAAARCLEAAVEERVAAGGAPVPTTVQRVPGGYVAGEESALVQWLDGGPGRPTFRPGRPAFPRLGGRPAVVDNPETLATVALIARHGPAWFRALGTPDAPGTVLLTVSGAVAGAGVVEVPLGTPLRSVLDGAGAARPTGGVLLGGYGGSWVAPAHLDVPLAPGPLATIGASLGAGVVVALPDSTCGIAETARIVRWMATQSAGQCGPCVFGLPAIAADLDELTGGHQPAAAVQRLGFRLAEVEGRGACHHPDGVVRMVRSAMHCFAEDLERHLSAGPCAGVHAPTLFPLPRPDVSGQWR